MSSPPTARGHGRHAAWPVGGRDILDVCPPPPPLARSNRHRRFRPAKMSISPLAPESVVIRRLTSRSCDAVPRRPSSGCKPRRSRSATWRGARPARLWPAPWRVGGEIANGRVLGARRLPRASQPAGSSPPAMAASIAATSLGPRGNACRDQWHRNRRRPGGGAQPGRNRRSFRRCNSATSLAVAAVPAPWPFACPLGHSGRQLVGLAKI